MAEDRINAMPIQNTIVQIILNGNINSAGVIGALVIIAINNSGTIEINKLIDDDITLETGKIYLGIYTLVIREAFPTIDIRPILVASLKKLKNTIPTIKYTAKFGISDLNNVEKTRY